MLHKSKKGAALVTVIMIMLVLTILGFSILGVSLAEAKHAEWEDKRIQSHYIGRSGVYVGLKILDDKLAAEYVTDINTLVSDLNTYVNTMDASTFKVEGKGNFTLKYEVFESGNVKIRAVGTAAGNPSVSQTVTYTVKIVPAMNMNINPTVWISGVNLKHGINPSDKDMSFLGKGVMLSSKPIQSPMGGDKPSTFQASIIYFRDSNGLCFKQLTNSVPITLDGEIIYFESEVELENNKNNPNKPVILAISQNTIEYRMNNEGVLPKFSPSDSSIVGFENYDRYKAFIGSNTQDFHASYVFGSGNYGVVYFGGDVVERKNKNETGNLKVNKGYYFYKNGVNLHNLPTSPLDYDLIPINDNDAIIKAIKELFRSKAGKEGALWDKK